MGMTLGDGNQTQPREQSDKKEASPLPILGSVKESGGEKYFQVYKILLM